MANNYHYDGYYESSTDQMDLGLYGSERLKAIEEFLQQEFSNILEGEIQKGAMLQEARDILKSDRAYGIWLAGKFPDLKQEHSCDLRLLAIFKDRDIGNIKKCGLYEISKAVKADAENEHDILEKALDQLASRPGKVSTLDTKKSIAKAKGEIYKPPPKPEPWGDVEEKSSQRFIVRTMLDDQKENDICDEEAFLDITKRRGIEWETKRQKDMLDAGIGIFPGTANCNNKTRPYSKWADEDLKSEIAKQLDLGKIAIDVGGCPWPQQDPEKEAEYKKRVMEAAEAVLKERYEKLEAINAKMRERRQGKAVPDKCAKDAADLH